MHNLTKKQLQKLLRETERAKENFKRAFKKVEPFLELTEEDLFWKQILFDKFELLLDTLQREIEWRSYLGE